MAGMAREPLAPVMMIVPAIMGFVIHCDRVVRRWW